jgi:hypothetical protein
VVQTGKGRIQPDLRAVAEGSGGRVIDGRKLASLDDVFVSVLDELRQQYAIAFAPPEGDGAVPRLEVRLEPAGLRARHRAWRVGITGPTRVYSFHGEDRRIAVSSAPWGWRVAQRTAALRMKPFWERRMRPCMPTSVARTCRPCARKAQSMLNTVLDG